MTERPTSKCLSALVALNADKHEYIVILLEDSCYKNQSGLIIKWVTIIII
ncbi:MAG: hypothetical protein CMIDDMOC_00936 [Sodalis sp. Fle]|nr:MAG: hypothetical protein CMIDDMOC_00936 [Sodalis sp. Fle]